MRCVYFCLGAKGGERIKWFLKRPGLPVPPAGFEIHAFEPNPDYGGALRKVFEGHSSDWSVDYRAASTSSGDGIDFSEHLKSFPDYYVIVDLQFEDTEPLIDKLVADGTLELVDELWGMAWR